MKRKKRRKKATATASTPPLAPDVKPTDTTSDGGRGQGASAAA